MVRYFAMMTAGAFALLTVSGCPAPDPEPEPEPAPPVVNEEEPVEPEEPAEPEEPVEPDEPEEVAEPEEPAEPVPAPPVPEEGEPEVEVDEVEVEDVDLADAELIAQGAELWQTKICFTCHQTDPDTEPLNPVPGPSFVGGIFGEERRVHVGIGGPIETVEVDEEYFIRALVEPQARIVEGYGPPAMMPPQPLTEEEIIALMAYVKSLDED